MARPFVPDLSGGVLGGASKCCAEKTDMLCAPDARSGLEGDILSAPRRLDLFRCLIRGLNFQSAQHYVTGITSPWSNWIFGGERIHIMNTKWMKMADVCLILWIPVGHRKGDRQLRAILRLSISHLKWSPTAPATYGQQSPF
jgi:hypothetical protein